ncbi:DUF262 domain-containing protein [Listeria monocytogenes]|uniref:DUF262 domain-containing protein n=1 Tax=Listeria monocytogenes TaxID=1639 RepID=UPI0011EAB261|nr:DUF262 domain-containing protein [Listeria monocytogenes]EAF2799996.1 DUF262 domain-containing protein [Listeria monocytogenes]EBB5818301.1 DUF262 domain-containing protein [Listeria monocytogenes]ECB9772951.1 DUF262 domain-containing protein [Listeria monocytogenes]TYV85715.1 DUF262 domain-containing protein [Listeria monocytogenes]HDI4512430.1 DUF262 domain-containing protein [Listeria monocytogenes]
MENSLELKTINELSEYKFMIPAYQRGYRWTTQEVTDLLNDVHEFIPKQIDDSSEKTWYCLQPIVLKLIDNENYEVIDGQQRLTTIFLILHYLNQDFIEKRREKLFELDYETRSDLKEFLISLDSDFNMNESLNIDYYHIVKAYLTIEEWFQNRGSKFNKDDFRSKFRFNTKIIWYECFEDDTISVFTRLNIGKISLSNAELIKALFLNSSNFEKNEIKIKHKQIEIASEWDRIESDFQDDRFWYFITGDKKTNNRIEFIFDIMNTEYTEEDLYSTFRYFSILVSSTSKDNIEKNWKSVKDYYMRFSEWYRDRELYHKIGYLISINLVNINTLYKESSSKTKKEFKKYLDELIIESMNNIDFFSLSYGDTRENLKIKNVLLLYNILTMLRSEKDNSFFPFNLYKNEKWDIEHITSVKESMPSSTEQKRSWLDDVNVYIDIHIPDSGKLKKRIKNCDVSNDADFNELFEDIISHFNHYVKSDDEINGLSNLTLLDSETNRGYKNAIFPIKRKTIIDRDKKGAFIPICTKNVFLKYFSEYPPKISFWTQEDRENYELDLRDVLSGFVEGL